MVLGDVNLVDDSLSWLAGLGRGGDEISDTLNSYLSAYYQAASESLNERGAPIIEWLARQSGVDEQKTTNGDRQRLWTGKRAEEVE
jgi:hypothetical protein